MRKGQGGQRRKKIQMSKKYCAHVRPINHRKKYITIQKVVKLLTKY